MEQNFKKILQKTKVWNQGSDPLSHTYEGALFKDSSWIFHFDESLETKSEAAVAPVGEPQKKALAPLVEAPPVLKADTLSLVLFVGDSYKGEGEDLLGKMISAMKLKAGEFNRLLLDEKLDEVGDLTNNLNEPSHESKELFSAILKFKPQIVVSLGATVTNILLGKREKLSGIHGQFFDRTIKLDGVSHSYELTPIFHPDFLVINPNMKRTAWIDLQKVMERVGKI